MAEKLKVYITRENHPGAYQLADIKIDQLGDMMDAIRYWGVETPDGTADAQSATGTFFIEDDDAIFLITVPDQPATPPCDSDLF